MPLLPTGQNKLPFAGSRFPFIGDSYRGYGPISRASRNCPVWRFPIRGADGASLDTEWYEVSTKDSAAVTVQGGKIQADVSTASEAARIVLRDGSGGELNLRNTLFRMKVQRTAGASDSTQVGVHTRVQDTSSYKNETNWVGFWRPADGVGFRGWTFDDAAQADDDMYIQENDSTTGDNTGTTFDHAAYTNNIAYEWQFVVMDNFAKGAIRTAGRTSWITESQTGQQFTDTLTLIRDGTSGGWGGIVLGFGSSENDTVFQVWDIEVWDLDLAANYNRPIYSFPSAAGTTITVPTGPWY